MYPVRRQIKLRDDPSKDPQARRATAIGVRTPRWPPSYYPLRSIRKAAGALYASKAGLVAIVIERTAGSHCGLNAVGYDPVVFMSSFSLVWQERKGENESGNGSYELHGVPYVVVSRSMIL